MASSALELLQSVKRNASVRIPPALLCEIFLICPATISMTSRGATRPSMATISSTRLATGKKLAIEMSARSAGNSAKKK
jgi:hypothetical protein